MATSQENVYICMVFQVDALMKNCIEALAKTSIGDVAQLARALDWQSRGRRFESALLHLKGFQFWKPFFIQWYLFR